jgi:hypothetical protein
VHAAEPGPLLLGGGDLAGLVVGDHEAALVVELQAVDDAPQQQALDVELEVQLEADGVDPGGVLELEVPPDHGLGVVEEGVLLLVVEVESGEVGVGAQLLEGLVELGEARGERAVGGGEGVEALEGAVDERPPRGGHGGWLRQAVDGGEAEGEGAVGEAGHLRGRQRVRQGERHGPQP